MQKVGIVSQGQHMEGTLFVPRFGQKSFAGVIMFPGMTGTQDKYLPSAQMLVDSGIAVLTVNLRAHGGSEGTMDSLTATEGYQDVLAVYDFFLTQEGIDVERIGVLGSSYGGMLTALLSKDRKIKSILLRGPAVYTEHMMHMTYEALMSNEKGMFFDIENVENCPSPQAIKEFSGSLLVVASGEDAIIPIRIPEAYISCAKNALSTKLEVIEGSPHSLKGEFLEAFGKRTVDWFIETL